MSPSHKVVYESIRGMLTHCKEEWEGHNCVLVIKLLNYVLITPYQVYYQFMIVSRCVIDK